MTITQEILLDTLANIVQFCSNIFTICASGIAIYVFVSKRKSISSAFQLLRDYDQQRTFVELEVKLKLLEDCNAGDSKDHEKALNLLSDIEGQISGNEELKAALPEELAEMEKFRNQGELNERTKKKFVSQLREQLNRSRAKRSNTVNIDDSVGD